MVVTLPKLSVRMKWQPTCRFCPPARLCASIWLHYNAKLLMLDHVSWSKVEILLRWWRLILKLEFYFPHHHAFVLHAAASYCANTIHCTLTLNLIRMTRT